MSSDHADSHESSHKGSREASPEVVVDEKKSSQLPHRNNVRAHNLRQVPLVNYDKSSHPTGETSEGHPKRRVSAKRKTSPYAATEKKKRVSEVPAEEEEEGEEEEISNSMMKEELEEIVSDYRLDLRVITCRLPVEGEVASSDVPLLICLFRYMFLWGLRIPLGEAPPSFRFLVEVLAGYGLSPGQLVAPFFITILGFWAFLFLRFGDRAPISWGIFTHFFNFRKVASGQYSFHPRVIPPRGHPLSISAVGALLRTKSLSSHGNC